MRILNDLKKFNEEGTNIYEINEIDLIKGWDKEDAGNESPTALFLQFDGEYVGTYQIDCNEKKYEDAMFEYNDILNNLLTKGYAILSWFNIIWN